MREVREIGKDIQKEPYRFLLSQKEKQQGRNLPLRMMLTGGACGLSALYYITRHNELHRIRGLSISLDLVFGLVWRLAITGLATEMVTKRLFVNYDRLREHKMAEIEIKKIVRTWPDPKPYQMPHQKPNSYFWV